MFKRLIDKSNCIRICTEHLKTLDSWDKWFFFGFPTIMSFLFCFFTKASAEFMFLSGVMYNVALIVLALFLSVITKIILKQKKEELNELKNEVLKETLTNISFTFLISLLGLVLTLFRFPFPFFHFYTAILFFVSFTMVLKRVYSLLLKELLKE